MQVDGARRAPSPFLLAAVTAAACTAYLAWHLARGWLPHDDGTLGLNAERVLRGAMPHRDFDEIYTGGLSYFQALAIEVLGNHLMSLRWEMLAVFAAWVPALFYIAARFVPPLLAVGVAALAVAWSVPNYNVPMPSWYSLFLATFGLAALLRHVDDPRSRWLFVAGLCGGISFLVKSIALYYVAGALLCLVFRAQAASGDGSRRAPVYASLVTLAIAAFLAALVALVMKRAGASEVYQHIVPAALLCVPILQGAWRPAAAGDRERAATLMRLCMPFLAGVALPVALFLAPYVASGAAGAFVEGVFVRPTRRLDLATYAMPPLWTALGVVPLVALAAVSARLRGRLQGVGIGLAASIALAMLVATGSWPPLYQVVWWSISNLLPVLAAIAAWLLVRHRVDAASGQRIFAATAIAALCNLVQYPFGVPLYFCYVAPLVLLAAVALAVPMRVAPAMLAGLVLFYAAFGALRLNTAPMYYMGRGYWPWPALHVMQTERARGIASLPQFADFDRLAAVLREHARGSYVWASPDAPEVYYLSGFASPTRTVLEIFDEPAMDDAAVLRMLDERGITAIALNSKPEFSPPIRASLYRELTARYPRFENVGHFQVRWRE